MNELKLDAKTENLNDVIAFMDERLEEVGCPTKVQIALDIAVEEIFVNIAHYAYGAEGAGGAVIQFDINPEEAIICFIDEGTPYNPLEKKDPDITLSVEERPIGGLGIYMVKKSMDDVIYKRENDKNILTICKKLEK